MRDLPFSQDEYDDRIARTRAAMEQAQIEVIIISDPSNMAWLTGYDGWSFYVHQAVVLGMEGQPIWWGRGIDANGARRTVFMDDDYIHGYDDSFVQNPPFHPMTDMARLIEANALQDKPIGVEMDNYYFSALAFQTLQRELPDTQFVDTTGLVNWQRAVKSPAEIEFMRHAARIVEEMHATARNVAEPGMAKNKLISEIYETAIAGADGHWGDYPAIVPMAPSGLDATAPHLTWNDKALKEGEATFFELAGVYRRYHCPQSRTIFIGKPPQRYLDAEKAVLEAVEAGLDVARPGNQCQDIANAFNATLNRLGFEKDNRCGYSVGLSYPPDWGERTMSFRRGDTSELKPGMCFHFMPALWLDDGGLEMSEPILITEDGVECLTSTPRPMHIV
jgi:ectoine hydrolase